MHKNSRRSDTYVRVNSMRIASMTRRIRVILWMFNTLEVRFLLRPSFICTSPIVIGRILKQIYWSSMERSLNIWLSARLLTALFRWTKGTMPSVTIVRTISSMFHGTIDDIKSLWVECQRRSTIEHVEWWSNIDYSDRQVSRQQIVTSCTNTFSQLNRFNHSVPFLVYCDSFGDLAASADENPSMCDQCISPLSGKDDRWDGSDASDEQTILVAGMAWHLATPNDFQRKQYRRDSPPLMVIFRFWMCAISYTNSRVQFALSLVLL